VRDLPAEALNWSPGEEMNSIYVLLTHLLGSQRFWLSAALGETIERDREAEFRVHGASADELLRLLDEADARNREMLARLRPAMLSATFTGHRESHSGAWCLIHAMEHTGQHHAHAAMTRQLWEQQSR
jgi:uncharacterized damage-inducible protein DinB